MAENFTVANQKQVMMQTTGGQWVDGMQVTYKTTDGVEGSVTVPLTQYSANHVRLLIEARVAQINEIATL